MPCYIIAHLPPKQENCPTNYKHFEDTEHGLLGIISSKASKELDTSVRLKQFRKTTRTKKQVFSTYLPFYSNIP